MKKILSFLLCTTMLLSLSLTACAAETQMNDTFSDVPDDAWYAGAVEYVRSKSIMVRTSDATFSPDSNFTRAQLATVLYRIAGEPDVTGEDSFSDTERGAWYSDAVLWAEQNDVIEGIGGGLFGTNDPTTQEQLVTMLWRMAGEPDAAAASDASVYAAQAVTWARENGITDGGFTFAPKEEATRAMVAWMTYRYLNLPERAAEIDIPQTGWTAAVPAAYSAATEHPGTVVTITYDSKDYARDGAAIQKTADVYLPYGYDEADTAARYDIIYLMHGWTGHAGEYFSVGNGMIKNMLDHMIENGELKPMIAVSPSFYADASDNGFSSSVAELRQFHQDFQDNLIPAVEGQYHTYAKSTSDADLKASRDHRAFGGFSLGSVTTWLEFCYDYDYIRWFLPMSGSCWYYGTYGDFQIVKNVDFIERLVKDENLGERGYFIYHAVGTNDSVKSQSIDMAEEMLSREIFTPDHYVFYQKDGGYHDFNAVREYIYNALPLFFPAKEGAVQTSGRYTRDTAISDVMNDSAFGGYGRLIFPANSSYYSGDTLGNLRLTWYSGIDPDKTVEICNDLKDHAEAGDTIFYDIYTDAEKAADPAKANTGLFFFRGEPGAKFAICNAGGGFAYVGAMHDSFPHALELSKMGYNAFALIYRPDWETAMEDLGRAIRFIEDNADALGIDPDGYSLWGGSAGARMAAALGNADGLAYYTGRADIPQAAAVIMQYTGHSETSRADAPTYANCGTSDGIANYRTMENRLNTLTSSYGIPTEFHAYNGLPHGFGLGTGTVAEGWINDAVAFWERNM